MLAKRLLNSQERYAQLLEEQALIRKQLIAIQKQELHEQGGELMTQPKGVLTAFCAGALTGWLKGTMSFDIIRIARLFL
ncbi:hypothetical protein [Pseudoalteromonas pernae]|uniref:hypothetical protein n=1 Tax=Pseudoalteromonas pernae TaxID=3118054 RepID=UPI003241BA16